MNIATRMASRFFFCVALCCAAGNAIATVDTDPPKTETQLKFESEKAKEAEARKEAGSAVVVGQLTMPEDTSPRLQVSEVLIVGNSVILTEELLEGVPSTYNASVASQDPSDNQYLYDFTALRGIIENPGQARQISTRTIRGFTQYILSVYRDRGYAGIFVAVPPDAFDANKELKGDVLRINITEAPVVSITSGYFTPDNEKVEEGFLKDSFLKEWTPIEIGEVGKQKELEDYVNLLNINPDRYISAKISRGEEPDTLAIGYNVYEADPWHWFVQVDNAGTKDRRYAPRIGLINTNLMGIDDKFTFYHQSAWEKNIEDKYSVYGSYDIPIMGPKLRVELYAGYSQFDIDGGAGIDFLGHGSLYGAELRYNFYQNDGWFFDFLTSLTHEESKVTSPDPALAAGLGTKVGIDLWGVGFDIHKRSDMANTSVTVERLQSIGGSSQDKFSTARTGAKRDFVIYTTTANYSRYLDIDKIQRVTGMLRWIVPDERLIPAKMTTFGGMYSVRGYKESGIVADGGIIAQAQYEYDLVRRDVVNGVHQSEPDDEYELKKLAPLVFFDYGRAKIEDDFGIEKSAEEMYSVGVGGLIEIGESISGAVYYGWPLKKTTSTDTDDGRLNLSLMVRW